MMRLKQILTPPTFEDSEKTRQVRLFNIIIILVSITALIPAFIVVAFPAVSLLGLLPVIVIWLTGTVTLVLARRGQVQLASLIFCSVGWATIMTTALFFGGVNSSAFSYVILLVLAVGLLMGWRTGSLFVILSIAAGLGLVYLENNNLLPASLEIATVLNVWANRSALLVMTIMMVFIATGAINEGLAVARRNHQALVEERNLLRTIIDNLPDSIYVKDVDTRFVLVNKATAQSFGAAKPSDVIGKKDSDLFQAELAAQYYADDKAVIDSGQRIVDKEEPSQGFIEDNPYWHLTTKVALRDSNDQIIGLVGITRDITRRKLADDELRQVKDHLEELVAERTAELRLANANLHHEIEERRQIEAELQINEVRLRQVINLIPHRIFAKDKDGRYLLANQALADIYGTTIEALLGQINSFLPPETLTQLQRDDCEVIDSGQPKFIPEEVLPDKDGKPRILQTTKIPFTQPGNRQPAVLGISIDITEQKQIQERLHQQAEQRKHLLEASQAMLSTLALDSVVEQMAHALQHILKYHRCALFWIDENASLPDPAMMSEEKTKLGYQFVQAVFPPGFGIMGDVAKSGQAQLVNNVHLDPRTFYVPGDNRREEHLLCLPVKTKDGVVQAVFSIYRPFGLPFNQEEFELAQLFVALAAVAIENARLYHQAQQEIIERKQVEAARNQLETQLLHSQKMEAIGQLAGGIAHDFNNLLTAIMGFTGFAIDSLTEEHPAYADIQGIQRSAQRAAELTRQLLAFARRQMVQPSIVNLNEVLRKMDQLLRRLIRADISLHTVYSPTLGQVKIDPSQMEQVVINLVVNACDAMPDGGQITIETSNIILDKSYAAEHSEVTPGEYIMISVSDTGQGMTDDLRSHIFEPFFTTKEVGKGTGLGLAMCFGIVKQSEGHIWAYSEPNLGTTITIYLPRIQQPGTIYGESADIDNLPQGAETILVTEDEDEVRELAVRVLQKQGYTVLEATNGEQALSVVQQSKQKIDLLITDVVMPKMGGKILAERLKASLPNLKILFISGYAGKAIFHQTLLDQGDLFLSKPFVPSDLIRQVRIVLDD